ncbi:MAG TPA: hypothetical protein VGQ57_02135 [Polyangiaceae bacterium]|nr:hypothetical protein [Polyangiaceae bacterium]
MTTLERRPIGPGAALALGTVAAAIAALPDVRRVAEGVTSPGLAWLGLAGSTALVLGPLLVLATRVPVRAARFRGAFLAIALAGLPLALLGQVLKAHTHHRPLGAATFGLFSLALVLLSLLVAVRFTRWVGETPTGMKRRLFAAVTALAFAGAGLALLRALASEGLHHDVIDGLRVLAASALARMALDQPRVEMWAKRAGVVAWLAFVAGGVVAARGPLGESIRQHAAVLGGPMAWL